VSTFLASLSRRGTPGAAVLGRSVLLGGEPLDLSGHDSLKLGVHSAQGLRLFGAAARVALLARSSDYAMEGPLGGTVTAAFEVAALLVLLGMSRGAIFKAPASVLLAGSGAAVFAFRNRLNLSGDAVSDSLFVLAHCCDLLAALAYLLRAALIEGSGWGGVSVGFAHALMPLQASLSAYYFLQAFPFSAELVAQGQPFAVLQAANTVACGAYLAAAALYVAECLEEGRRARRRAAGAALAPGRRRVRPHARARPEPPPAPAAAPLASAAAPVDMDRSVLPLGSTIASKPPGSTRTR
ncbi:unnamed protein product, partial [Prorocentrum cordatum]